MNGVRWSTTRNIEVLRWSVSYSTVTKTRCRSHNGVRAACEPRVGMDLLDAISYRTGFLSVDVDN